MRKQKLRIKKERVRKYRETPACFVYWFHLGKQQTFGRIWPDSPRRGEILNWRDKSGRRRLFSKIPYSNRLLLSAANHLFTMEGVEAVYIMVVQKRGAHPIFQKMKVQERSLKNPDKF